MRQSTRCLTALLIASLTACNQEQTDTNNTGATVSKADLASPLPPPHINSTTPKSPTATVPPSPVIAQSNQNPQIVETNQDKLTGEQPDTEFAKIAEKESKKESHKNKEHVAKLDNSPPPPPMTEAEKQALFEKRAKDEADLQAAARKNIHSDDNAVRLGAVLDLKPEDATDQKLLLDALNTDPDPKVKAEIAGRLGFGDFPLAVPGLIKSLEDKDPAVVLTAIESLSWYDGSEKNTIISALGTLQNHPVASVRDAAQKTLTSLNAGN